MASLCGHQRDFDSGAIAHFADENDFRRLSQCRSQTIRIIVKVRSEFALVKSGLATWMHELNRILQGDNVHRLRFVNFVEDCSQGSGFTAAGRTGQENQSGFFPGNLSENAGKMKCLQRWNAGFKAAQNDRKISTLPKNINAKARLIVQRITEVAGAAVKIIIHQPPIALHQRQCYLLGLIGGE